MDRHDMWMVFKNVVTLVRARGYGDPPGDLMALLGETEAQGRAAWGRQFANGMINTDTLGFTAHLREGERTTKRPEKLLVRFFREAKLGVGPVRDYSEELAGQLAGERSKHCLLVIGGAQTPSAKKEILKVQKNKLYIEVFTCLELLCDVLNHELVPKHEPLSDEEKTLVMKEYNATAEQIPRIRTTDPVMRWLGVTKNTLVRITRKSNDQEYVTYRMAVGQ